MLFNSIPYIFVFLPLAAILFGALRARGHVTAATGWLLLASLAFYAINDLKGLPVLLGSILFNYGVSIAVGPPSTPAAPRSKPRRGLLLATGIAGNLLVLFYFKYFSQLPLGLSFFTLVQVMYLVDVYEGLIMPNTMCTHAACTAFFATVSMGPITRIRDLRPQLTQLSRGADAAVLATAIAVFAVGLFKKVVLADGFARLADAAFTTPAQLSVLESWVGSVVYSLQLYFDFSGYSDMAIATALFLGVTIPVNFNSPYHATSIIEFWRRWHISLSNFITTYLYTPLVRTMGRITFPKAMLATLVAMVIVGLWHGSTANFAAFGALHGIGLVGNHVWKKCRVPLPKPLAWVVTFIYVDIAFVFFRAPTWSDALSFLRSMTHLNTHSALSWTLAPAGAEMKAVLPLLILGVLIAVRRKNSTDLLREFRPSHWNLWWVVATVLLSLLYLNTRGGREFIYNGF
jgi:alginate O-acetyltransferase complex protein AlgI